jgi:hypothetical protein
MDFGITKPQADAQKYWPILTWHETPLDRRLLPLEPCRGSLALCREFRCAEINRRVEGVLTNHRPSVPQIEIIEERALGWRVFGNIASLTVPRPLNKKSVGQETLLDHLCPRTPVSSRESLLIKVIEKKGQK